MLNSRHYLLKKIHLQLISNKLETLKISQLSLVESIQFICLLFNVKKEKSKRKPKIFEASAQNFTLLIQSNSYQWNKKNNNCLLGSSKYRTIYSGMTSTQLRNKFLIIITGVKCLSQKHIYPSSELKLPVVSQNVLFTFQSNSSRNSEH